MNKDDLKEKAYDITLGLAKRKYEEELKRNDIINTKAGFLLTAISILIGTIVTLLCCSAENVYKDYKLVNWFAIIVLVLLVFGFIMTVLSQIFYKRNHIPHVDSVIEELNKGNCNEKNDLTMLVINTYNQTIKSIDSVNTKCTKFLMTALISMIVAISLAFIFALIIFSRSF